MQNTFIGYTLGTARKYHKKRKYLCVNTFIGYLLGTTRKYHKKEDIFSDGVFGLFADNTFLVFYHPKMCNSTKKHPRIAVMVCACVQKVLYGEKNAKKTQKYVDKRGKMWYSYKYPTKMWRQKQRNILLVATKLLHLLTRD